MAEGIASSFLGKISGYLVAPIGQQFGYVFRYNRNIEKMRRQAEELEAKRCGVQLLVDAAKNNCQVIGPDVELWLKNVEKIKAEANSILSEEEKAGEGCLNEWCLLNLKLRYWLSRKATETTQEVIDLLAKGNFQTVSCPPPALGQVPKSIDDKKKTQRTDEFQVEAVSSAASEPDLGNTSTSTSSPGGLESRFSIIRDVMEAIRDDNIRTIGICGMGGVGKTTMVHEVDRIAREERLFDEVVMAVVSKEPEEKSIQLDIADLLSLKLEEHNLLARASRLHERLTQKGSNDKPKRILVILDDLWKKLDLKKVGIPFGDDHSGCKIVLTSRSRDVCVHMKADKIYSIPVLPENEAWILFKNSLLTTNLYPVATEIVKECGGLPIAITTIAMVLADKEEDTWNYVLGQLERSSLEGEYAAVYKVFELSYDNLEPKEIKDVFLLCCLFPEDFDIPIEDLARYGMGRRFFQKVYKLYEARQKARAHVEVLKNLNLLLDSEKEECVKMHDLVRDFGISIASKGEFFVRFDKGLKDWPMEDECEQYTSISMQCDEMDEFPNELKYPNLKLLQMWGSNSRPFKFPERLDEIMGELQVLALRSISIPSLLGSVERLSKLRTLSLCDCELNEDVSRIGNIEKLEILSFVGSDIKELPREIGKLSRLRLLDLTGCENLQKIAPDVLSKLVRLEELYMRRTPIRWAEQIRAPLNDDEEEEEFGDDEGEARDDETRNNEEEEFGDDEEEAGDDEETYASFTELKKLSNLVAIDIHIPYMFLPIDLNLKNLEKFNISVGFKGGIEEVYQNALFLKADEIKALCRNTLKLVGDEIAPLKCLLKALCRKTEILYVRVKDLKNLCNEVERKDLSRLKFLCLESCEELVSVFDDGMNQSFNIHSSPLVLIPPFGNLRNLQLINCSKLKSVFSLSIARGLINLETLDISECSGIEEIISKERGDDDQDEKEAVEFLNLKKINLEYLPNLVSFCKAAVDEVKFPQLKKLKLKKLPKITSIYPEMKTSSSSSSDGHHAYAAASSSTNHPFFHQKVTLTNLEKVQVLNMENMTTVFPKNVILQLQSLESLSPSVENCKSVELQGSNLNEGHHQVFSQFQSISLDSLPKLTSVWKLCPRAVPAFQNLKFLVVTECDSLRHLFTPSMAKTLVRLETLEISTCSGIEEIISKERGDDDQDEKKAVEFLNLKKMELYDLPNLVSFCKVVVDEVKFPQLKEMTLNDLPKITSIYPEMKTSSSSSSDGHRAYASSSSSSTNHPLFHQKVTLTNLEALDVWNMENMTTVFPENVIPLLLQSLQVVQVWDCKSVEVVFDLQGSNINEGHHQLFSQFQSIDLRELPKLTSVWKLCPRVVPAFQNLKSLRVEDCDSLRHLFTPFMAKTLVRLETLAIGGCSGIEEIISKERGDDDQDEKEAVEFLNLKEIKLEYLPNLVSFCKAAVDEVKFPQLKEMKLGNLPKIASIYPEMKTSSSDGHHAYASSSSSTNHPFFHQKVTLINLEELEVYNMENITTVFSENVIPQLQSLEFVRVWYCSSVEVVFDLQGSNLNEGHHQLFSQFQSIYLRELPKLTSVWKLCPRVVPGFQNLKSLYVIDCDSLRHLFTPSMAKTLVRLDFLSVNSCEILEAIVAAEEGEEDEKEFTTEEAILFPKLTDLDLEKLPSLLTILPEPYSFNWSSLKQIKLEEEKSHLLRRPNQVSV